MVIFESSLPEKFRLESELLLEEAKQSLVASLPTDYLHLRVHVSAKTINDAANRALDTIDFIRGVWNLTINSRELLRTSLGGKRRPVNRIILGPLHTLHRTNGVLAATNTWWYEPSYTGSLKPLPLNQNELVVIYKFLNDTKKKLKTHKYPKVIFSAITRYTRALDERDWTTAFLKLWSILELLTDTTRESNEETIKRTLFICKDRDYHFQVLKHLSKYRNSSIHLDKENSEIEVYMYQTKRYVEALINFHIRNKFNSIMETADFLSLPYDVNTLEKQLKKRQFAKKFRGSLQGD